MIDPEWDDLIEGYKDVDRDIEDTVDKLNPQYLITLEGNLGKDVSPKAVCECGWETEPDTNLLALGRAAKEHAIESPQCILRPHDVER